MNAYVSYIVYSLTDEHLGYFHFGAIMSINYSCACRFVVMFSFLYLGAELLGHSKGICLTLPHIFPPLSTVIL